MGTSLLPPLSLLELLTKGEYSLSKDSVVNCQEIQCFLLLAAAWATHKLFSPPQHSSASAQHLALLTLIRCLQLLFLLASALSFGLLSDTSLSLPQIPHRGRHLTALSTTLLHRNHSAFFPSEGSLSSSWKGEQNCPAAQQQPEGREVDFQTICAALEFKPIRCGGANSPALGSHFKDGHLLQIPQQRRDADKVLGSVKVRTENLQAQPSPRTSSREDIITRWKLPPHRVENTSIRANLASTPWDIED